MSGDQPFQPDGKADPRNIRTAEIPNEMVVTAAAQDRILCAEEFRGHFEGGPRIVIETTDHFGINVEWDLKKAQARLELCEMIPAGGAEKIRQMRGVSR